MEKVRYPKSLLSQQRFRLNLSKSRISKDFRRLLRSRLTSLGTSSLLLKRLEELAFFHTMFNGMLVLMDISSCIELATLLSMRIQITQSQQESKLVIAIKCVWPLRTTGAGASSLKCLQLPQRLILNNQKLQQLE